MGNTVSVGLREDAKTLEVTEQLVRDFQHHITLTDRSLVSFVRSIDTMRASCAIFQKNKRDALGSSGDGTSEAVLLLETIDEVIADHKFVALETIGRLFSFIMSMGKDYVTPDNEMKLCVDEYRRQNSVDTETTTTYYDARIELLQRKLKLLKEDYERLKENENTLNEREEIYQKQLKMFKKRIETLETDLANTKSEQQKAIRENDEKEQKIRELLKLNCVYKSKIDQIDEQNKELIKQAEILNQDLNDKLSSIETLKTEIDTLTNENASLTKESKKGKQKISLLRQENISTVTQFDKKIKDIEKDQIRAKGASAKELREMKDCFEQETQNNEELRKQLVATEVENCRFQGGKELSDAKVCSLSIDVDRLRATVEDKNASLKSIEEKSISQLNNWMLEKEQLQQDKNEKLSEIVQLTTETKLLHDEIAKMKSDHLDSEESYENDIQKLKESIEKANSKNYDLVGEIECLKEEKRRSKDEKDTSEKQVSALMNENENLQTKVETLEEKCRSQLDEFLLGKLNFAHALEEKHRSQFDEWLLEKQKLSEESIKKISEVEQITTQMKTLNDEIKECKTKCQLSNESYDEEIQKLKEFIEKEKRSKEELVEHLQHLEEEKLRSKEEKEALEKKVSDLINENQNLQAKVERLEEKCRSQLDEFLFEKENLAQVLQEKHRSQFDEWLLEKQKLSEESIKKISDVDQITTKVKTLQEEIEDFETKRQFSNESHEKEIKKLNEFIEKEKNLKEELLKQLQHLEVEKHRSKEEKEKLEKNVANLGNENENLHTKVSDMQINIDNMGEKHNLQLSELVHKVEKLVNEKTEQENGSKNLESNLNILQLEKTQLESDLANERKINLALKEESMTALKITLDEILQIKTTLQQQYESEFRRFLDSVHRETKAICERSEELQVLIDEKNILKGEKIALNIKLDQSEKECQRLKSECENYSLKIEELQQSRNKEIERLQGKLDKLKNKKKDIETRNTEIDNKMQGLYEKNSSLSLELKKEAAIKVSLIQEKASVISSFKSDIENLKIGSEEIKRLNEEEQEQLKHVKKGEHNQTEKYIKRLEQLEERKRNDSEDTNQLNWRVSALELDMEEKQGMIQKLELELELAKQNVIHVQVKYMQGFTAQSPDLELQNALKVRMAARCIQLQFLDCSKEFTPVSKDIPLLIVCSRTRGTREKLISSVLEGKTVTQKMAMLVFHERTEHNFRKDMQQNKNMVVGEIGGIFDIGCNKHELLKCDINVNTVARMTQFIANEGVPKSRSAESAV